MFINYMFVFLIFLVGVFLGGAVSDYRWASNSQEARRIYYNKNFYKVVLTHDHKSREYFRQID